MSKITENMRIYWNILKNSPLYISLFISPIFILIVLLIISPHLKSQPILFLMSIIILPLYMVLLASFIIFSVFVFKFIFADKKDSIKFYENKTTYSAVLIANSGSSLKQKAVNLHGLSILFLILYFLTRMKNYKLIRNVDVYDVDLAIKDKNCQELFLIGHGSKGCFKIKKDVIVPYKDYRNECKKQIISQMHCNVIKDELDTISLVDLLAIDKEKSFITKGIVTPFHTLAYSFFLFMK